MQPLKNVMAQWQPAASKTDDPVSLLRAHWAEIVGAEVAANSRPDKVVRDALLVVTRSSAWSQQLSFLSERILAALRDRSESEIARIRFRVGRLHERAQLPARRLRNQRVRPVPHGPAATLEAALDRFRDDVGARRRAKAAAGWKECVRCGSLIAPRGPRMCAPCSNAHMSERSHRIARLLFEVPFLGYQGIANHIEDLTREEYETVRKALLVEWWDTLSRLRRSSRSRQPTKRERDIASSYILLKSGLDPERIAPAVVRDLLGDELHDIFNTTENTG